MPRKIKQYGSIEEIIAMLRKECVGYYPDGSLKRESDWALTNGTVLGL